jgi:dTDP-4-dehydrorhamnose 3,5-epimerase
MDKIIHPEFTPLKVIPGKLGEVRHVLRADEPLFCGFGEAYFSSVNQGAVKGWKKHKQMTANLLVVYGEVRFVLFDPRTDSDNHDRISEFILSRQNYGRLTIPPGIWFAFQGVGENLNIILNISNILHDPIECDNLPIVNDQIDYSFS